MIRLKQTHVPLILLLSILTFGAANLLYGDDDDDDNDGKSGEHHSSQSSSPSTSKKVASKSQSATDLGAPGYTTLYKEECTSCHMAYHPALLPTASWTKMMASLKDHFGVDATLEAKTQSELLKFLVSGSAEKNRSRRAQKLLKSLKGNTVPPVSYSTTSYFKQKHHEISTGVFKRKGINSAANCLACHPRAEEGGYNEHEVKIPKG